MIRITVIGRKGCGKTSLINSFVQRVTSQDCSFASTERPTLYYVTVTINSDLAVDVGADANVIVEIEDVPGLVGFGKDIRGLSYWLNLERKEREDAESDKSQPAPFEEYRPPPDYVNRAIYRPIAPSRMGFIFTFDSTDYESFRECKEQISFFREELDERRIQGTPVLYLAATKKDLVDSQDPTHMKIAKEATELSLLMGVRLVKTSAMQGKNVDRIFRGLTEMVVGLPTLWRKEEQEEESSSEDEGCGLM
ncbi:MAG: uncharacterized protein KVP18_002304 [Porospora cf. gigantea A]|uniref:uncharacterized protein n=1 Tax=Porospora cf. gigantea A TaxID=2853593 RepID=UPI003559CCE9|nr:MAG: hypothetical protein KVP18_002304 [Porospora cf. gigantea A]